MSCMMCNAPPPENFSCYPATHICYCYPAIHSCYSSIYSHFPSIVAISNRIYGVSGVPFQYRDGLTRYMDSHDKDIKNNAWVTVNNDFFGHEWGDLAMIFTSDEVTSEKSLVNDLTSGQNIVIHGNECIILFLTRYFMSWAHSFANTIVDISFRHCRQGRSFLP